MSQTNVQLGQGRQVSLNAAVTVVAAAASQNQTDCGMGKAWIIGYTITTEADYLESKVPGTSNLTGGNVNAEFYLNHRKKLEMDIIFYDTTQAGAAAAFLIPSPGSLIAITANPAAAGDTPDTQLRGNWIVDSARKTASVDGLGTGSISCHQRASGDLTAITT